MVYQEWVTNFGWIASGSDGLCAAVLLIDVAYTV